MPGNWKRDGLALSLDRRELHRRPEAAIQIPGRRNDQGQAILDAVGMNLLSHFPKSVLGIEHGSLPRYLVVTCEILRVLACGIVAVDMVVRAHSIKVVGGNELGASRSRLASILTTCQEGNFESDRLVGLNETNHGGEQGHSVVGPIDRWCLQSTRACYARNANAME